MNNNEASLHYKVKKKKKKSHNKLHFIRQETHDIDISLFFKRRWEQSLAWPLLPWKPVSQVLIDNYHNLKADSPLK